jgi:hypothetical protein
MFIYADYGERMLHFTSALSCGLLKTGLHIFKFAARFTACLISPPFDHKVTKSQSLE